MRFGLVLGGALLVLGAWIATGNASYKAKTELLKIGDMKASVRETHVVPPWAGFVVLGAGALVILGSWRRPT